jgi:spore photoproduct lyase
LNTFSPEAIYIEKGAENYALSKSVLERFPQVPITKNACRKTILNEINETKADPFGASKKVLFLSKFEGSFLKKCPGISPGMVCCNYYIVNLTSNCIYDCSYCVLQDFLENNPILQAFVNLEDVLSELDSVFAAYPERTFRVGTGEIADSLALDDVIPHTDLLVPFFNRQKNAVLELKTKSACINNLLKHDPKNVVISWSVNPAEIVDSEEKGTANLDSRIKAAKLCQDNGYKVGFHFDPIIIFPGWETAYKELTDTIFNSLRIENIEWISLGSFRYRTNLKKVIKQRHPETILFNSEHVPSEDGKFRYLRPIRNKAYDTIRNHIRKRAGNMGVYLCMETKEVWESVTGKLPRSDKKLDQFFDL